MKRKKLMIAVGTVILTLGITQSCTKLDKKVYSVVPTANFYQTPDQIAAGVAPAYVAMQNIPDGNVMQMNEITSDEIVVPTRGNDWYDGGQWQSLWLHKFKPDVFVDGGWSDLNNGIGKINFTLNILNSLTNKPADINNVVAELKVLRAYFIFQFMDMFGNVPLVTDYNTDPSKVKQSSRADVYAFLDSELSTNIPLLSNTVDKTTYGRVTQYFGYMLQAKLYMNAQVYTGTAQWAKAITALNNVINSGKYILQPNYFDNFSVTNDNSTENIFVVPFDKVHIGNMNWEMQTLHYSSNLTYGLTGQPWNGFCSTADVYNKYDASDVRRKQFLVGQQYAADGKTPLTDPQANLPVIFDPNVTKISDASGLFRMAGARNIKYYPEAGTAGNQSNDGVIFRLADAYLMLAEASMHMGDNATALTMVNKVRERAGVADWTMSDLTYSNLLDERSRELMWEGWRRNDLIRFQVADPSTHYFTGPRAPEKVDDGDTHAFLFPIPAPELLTNPNLKQNPGY
ncbi:MAG TPA: RagB/SusD family nutrient uptake outer membrane protein [Mucilaginibacter sp.]|nr:RagB/SusD family nutrient uptake outer membrane protein [Mucilaginibacter sp.]HVW14427.1 RagB/SusD family nutrient uptake outer membrane protein [Mucilaginibacter sp.]